MRRVLALLLVGAAVLAAQQNSTDARPEYTKDGKLVLPKDYRQWVFLSAGIGMTYQPDATPNANPPFENVFVNPAAYREFMKTGAWPDKTVLVLEVRKSDSRVSINKNGRIQTTVLHIESHVKDAAKGGWAFYGFKDGAVEGTLFPKTATCYSCHSQNGATDTTFVQFYPTLIETAQKYRNYKETEH